MVEANHLISPANYYAHAGDVKLVQYYVSVDASKHFEPDVAGERYKPVCSVDRALEGPLFKHEFALKKKIMDFEEQKNIKG